MNRGGLRFLQAQGFESRDQDARARWERDEAAILTALGFALEALEEHPDPRISSRATQQLEKVTAARLARCQIDPIRELPPRIPPAAASWASEAERLSQWIRESSLLDHAPLKPSDGDEDHLHRDANSGTVEQ
jgi:hypothetical protein